MEKQPSLSQLVELAKSVKMDSASKEEQRRSFVHGNVGMEYPSNTITRQMVDECADALADER